jgi:hypothetical protein
MDVARQQQADDREDDQDNHEDDETSLQHDALRVMSLPGRCEVIP